ncbi:MoaD/ThiS family protein [Nocardioides sp. InS609-2]|uniref:MoaD/ThiS family protein n=1 Tax=Nocardioides sp. InS609-2 TaxID=2760705 RepID=UPI0020BE3F2C|nr:MoaD/ThiS family protein [Nocardioides sp. InS609-2]
MSSTPGQPTSVETASSVTVHYWAAARSAAGTDSDTFVVDGPVTLRDVLRMVTTARPSPELLRVLDACAMLVGDRPVGARSPDDVVVQMGETVEFLPPFAGG